MRKNTGHRRFLQLFTAKRNTARLKSEDQLAGSKKPTEQRTIEAARWCWEFSTSLCSSLCLLNLSKVSSFDFKDIPAKKLIIFYLHFVFTIPSGLHKFFVFGRRIFSDIPIDSITCFCVLPCIIYSLYFLIVSVVAVNVKEVQHIIHGWTVTLRHFNEKEGRNLTPFSYTRVAGISFQMFLSIMISVVGYVITSLVLHELPFVLAQTITELGLLPNSFPKWALCIILAPVEGYCYLVPLLVAVVFLEVVLTEITVAKLCITELRKENVDPESQAYIKKMLNTLRLQNGIFSQLVRSFIFPILFIAGCGVVFLLYLAIRDDKLPVVIIIIMTYTAIVILAAVYFISYEFVSIIQASEDVKNNLRPTLLTESYKHTPREVLQMHVKEAKALRLLEYPVGHFSMYSFDVAITFYEEVLNQLLFFLYL